MRKYAFTLAEILIVLAIIGVVAALTVPDLIQNTQGREFKTKLKKAISVCNQAIMRDIAINHTMTFTRDIVDQIGRENLRAHEYVTTTTACGKNRTGTLLADGIFVINEGDGDCEICLGSDCVCRKYMEYCLDVNGESGPNVKTTNPNKPQDGYKIIFCADDNSFKCGDATCKKVLKE